MNYNHSNLILSIVPSRHINCGYLILIIFTTLSPQLSHALTFYNRLRVRIPWSAPTSGYLQWQDKQKRSSTCLVCRFVIFFLMSAVDGMPENTWTIVHRRRSQHTPIFLEALLLENIALDIDYVFIEHKLNWFIISYNFDAPHVCRKTDWFQYSSTIRPWVTPF